MAEKSLGRLIQETVGDLRRLAKLEAALAGQKLKGSAQAAGFGAGAIGGGLVFAHLGLLILLVSAGFGLAIVLPLWAAFLIVGVVAIVAGGVLAMVGVASFRKASERASGATDQMKEDLQWVRGRTS